MKTRKRKTKSKSKNKTIKYHIIPKKKTKWSGDLIGEHQVININSWIAKKNVDNMNSIKGKYKNDIKEEYKRRLKIQLKKHKPSRKRFLNKTKKIYNNKTIDKILNKLTPKKIESVYKDLLKNEKP